MKTIRRWLNNPLVIGVLLAFFSMWDLLVLGHAYNLDKGEWASWVQAVGSIAAVMIAFYIADNQLQHARRLEEERAISEETRRANIIGGVLISSWTVGNSLQSAMQAGDVMFIDDFNWKTLVDLSSSLKSIPTLDVPDVTIVITMTPVPTNLEAVAAVFQKYGRDHRFTGYQHDPQYRFEWLISQDLGSKTQELVDSAQLAISACSTYVTHREGGL